ncbi:MAG: AbrB/MazE/SpoVT family DNA-binding domain-containing protein [Acidobacteriota bacterium]
MPNDVQVAKWGNSLAVRIPQAILREAGLAEGDHVSLGVAGDGSIVLRSAKPKYSLEELVNGITPKNRHGETDWGPPVGKEVW